MLAGRTVFAELLSHLSPRTFRTCVDRYDGNYKASRFSCWDQYLCLAFAQLTYRESLRDIEACLRALQPKLYHVGIRARVARSTLADANETRDWRIYADFAQSLIRTARALYVNDPLAVDLANTVYALDATTIDLCLSVFPWAHYSARHGAVKLHTLLDLRGQIPTVIHITPGSRSEIAFLDDLVFEAGAFYLMDRGYVDFTRLYGLTTAGAFFVTRAKANLCFTRRVSRPIDPGTGIRSDQLVVPTHKRSRNAYPAPLRRVHYVDPDTGKRLVFSHEQLHAARAHHRAAVPVALAGRALLQVDQATSAHQSLLRHQRECREDADLDRHLRLCPGRHRQETARPRRHALPIPPGLEPDPLRENAHFYCGF